MLVQIRLCRCFFPRKIIRFAAWLFGRSEYDISAKMNWMYVWINRLIIFRVSLFFIILSNILKEALLCRICSVIFFDRMLNKSKTKGTFSKLLPCLMTNFKPEIHTYRQMQGNNFHEVPFVYQTIWAKSLLKFSIKVWTKAHKGLSEKLTFFDKIRCWILRY